MNKRVVIIGGGLGGLSAAIRLARYGFDIQLFEQNPQLGGKMNEFHERGYRFDTGPSLITMPAVINDLFRNAGVERENVVELDPVEPICRYFWEDGTIINTSTHIDVMLDELSVISKKDAQNYIQFLDYCQRIYELTADIFLFNPIHEWQRILNNHNLRTLFRVLQIDPFRTVHRGVKRFFQHPQVIQLNPAVKNVVMRN